MPSPYSKIEQTSMTGVSRQEGQNSIVISSKTQKTSPVMRSSLNLSSAKTHNLTPVRSMISLSKLMAQQKEEIVNHDRLLPAIENNKLGGGMMLNGGNQKLKCDYAIE